MVRACRVEVDELKVGRVFGLGKLGEGDEDGGFFVEFCEAPVSVNVVCCLVFSRLVLQEETVYLYLWESSSLPPNAASLSL